MASLDIGSNGTPSDANISYIIIKVAPFLEEVVALIPDPKKKVAPLLMAPLKMVFPAV